MSDKRPLFISGYMCVTVAELIEHLKTLPQDAPVVYDCRSDLAALTIEAVTLIKAEDRKVVKRGNGVKHIYPSKQWGDEKPEFVTVVKFPGN